MRERKGYIFNLGHGVPPDAKAGKHRRAGRNGEKFQMNFNAKTQCFAKPRTSVWQKNFFLRFLCFPRLCVNFLLK
jgi:hypothetical protein